MIVACWLLSLSNVAEGRLFSPLRLEDIAQEADVLVVGRVVEVKAVGKIAEDQTQWRIPLLRMSATIRPLRCFPRARETDFLKSPMMSVPYNAIDNERKPHRVNGPEFPSLSPGDVYVFPLRRASHADGETWELIREENWGMLVPAVEQPPDLSFVRTAVRFLRYELASALSRGGYRDIFRAAKYLGYVRAEALEDVAEFIELDVADDRTRWLEIASAVYCSMPLQRPKLEDLQEDGSPPSRVAGLVARALHHADGEDLAVRFIEIVIEQAPIHRWGTRVTLSLNYARHPTTLRLLNQALDDDEPGALYLASALCRDADHPLIPTALKAATRSLRRPRETRRDDLRPACELIIEQGDEADFSLLLAEIRRTEVADREKYQALWQACAYRENPRLIAICGIVIEDRKAFSEDRRFCNVAAFDLQRVTGQDFGLRSPQTRAERNRAIKKARAWLEKNLPPSDD